MKSAYQNRAGKGAAGVTDDQLSTCETTLACNPVCAPQSKQRSQGHFDRCFKDSYGKCELC